MGMYTQWIFLVLYALFSISDDYFFLFQTLIIVIMYKFRDKEKNYLIASEYMEELW